MTKLAFQKLKVGDVVYLPDKYKKGYLWGTEVLEINKRFKKIKVFMHKNFLSYKYVYSERKRDLSYMVGLV